MADGLTGSDYLIRRKVFALLGAKFHVYDPSGRLVAFSQQKAFKLKEDIRVYSDESMTSERLVIKARQILDISAAYDVVDPATGAKVGALRRKGLSSMLRDSWQILDASDGLLGTIVEDSFFLAMVRRFLTNLIPQKFHAEMNGRTVATYRQHFNPFIQKLDVHVEQGAGAPFDPRLALASGILLVAIEGRQR